MCVFKHVATSLRNSIIGVYITINYMKDMNSSQTVLLAQVSGCKKSQINSQFTAENRPKWPQKEARSFPFTIHFSRGRLVSCWGGYLMFSEELKFHTSTNRLHCSLNSQLGLLKENETSGITERVMGMFQGKTQ